ncbi:MAG: threonine synthase [Desulfobacterales bacterium]|nr:threonine synthase [Desulfobacterales bacterium]
MKLFCTNCKKQYEDDSFRVACTKCNEPLEVEHIKTGNIQYDNLFSQSPLQRYQAFFPWVDGSRAVSLGEGFTPLVNADVLAERLGLKELWLKNETVNPTWSFKDRGTITGILHAVKLGYKRIGTVSTGNMAASVAAYGAKMGMETFVFVHESLPDEKLNPIAMYGPHVIKVQGDYERLYTETLKISAEQDIYFVNSDVPFRVEGYKALSFEICEQLEFNPPDYVVVPTGSGGNLRGILKGFEEFQTAGLIQAVPQMIVAQASGSAPIVEAYEQGHETVKRVESPCTMAGAIANPLPPSGNQVLRKLRDAKGLFSSVSENAIVKSQEDLAKAGFFVQPASAATLAVVKNLCNAGILGKNDRVSCILTGSGLKYTKAFKAHDLKHHTCKLDEINNKIREIG